VVDLACASGIGARHLVAAGYDVLSFIAAKGIRWPRHEAVGLTCTLPV